ncbi:MAG: HAD family hydrolase [Lentisphaerales bacterium]|nr:MAG: HAD family hydrolase [Lentisphaerales bacterium]
MTTRFKGVIFDMDGTITRPFINFQEIRDELGMPTGDLLEAIRKLRPVAQDRAWSVIERHETRALEHLELQDGASELMARCRRSGIKVGVLTRNVRRSVDYLLARFQIDVDMIVTREFESVKPDPGPVLHILGGWNVHASDVLVVGDYVDDIDCGRGAGTKTCFYQNPGKPFFGQDADFVVTSMSELERIIFPSRPSYLARPDGRSKS